MYILRQRVVNSMELQKGVNKNNSSLKFFFLITSHMNSDFSKALLFIRFFCQKTFRFSRQNGFS